MRRIDRPEPGFFRRRYVRKGAYVPGRIWRPCPMTPATPDVDPFEWGRFYDRPTPLCAEWAGRPADPLAVWAEGEPISEAEYAHLMATREWALAHAPDAPEADYRRRVDPRRMTAPQF